MGRRSTEWKESNEQIFAIRRRQAEEMSVKLRLKLERLNQPVSREASLISMSNILGHLEESIAIVDSIFARMAINPPDRVIDAAGVRKEEKEGEKCPT
jgi:hypothetical protein